MTQNLKIAVVATLLVFGVSVGFLNHALQNNLSLNPLQYLAQLVSYDSTQYSGGSYGAGSYGGGTDDSGDDSSPGAGGEIERTSGRVGPPDGGSTPPARTKVRTVENRGADFSGRTHGLRIAKENSNLVAFRSRRESDLANDASYRYPLGLYEFEAEVDEGETETVTIELDDTYDTSAWTYRKYIDGEYIDITEQVTFARERGVTTITYDVEDNGPLDSDNRLGFITDPAGPAIAEEEETSEDSSVEEDGETGDDSSEEEETSDSADRSSEDDYARYGTRISDRSEESDAASTDSDRTVLEGVKLNTNISFIQPQFNIQEEVRNLERFLNAFENEQLAVDGVYDGSDLEAVKRFQRKYSREILDVWDLTEATGYVGITTRLKINSLIQGQTTACPAFTQYNGGRNGIMESLEIGRTQEILRELDMYAGPINNRWDNATNQALITFQETFREVMLDPWNITEGTGYKYKTTNKFLNYFVGCETDAVYLEGVGTYEGI